ncbi:MAG: type II toxin-antitoxin system RelE/ParE family toxin [Streptosporangiaceae bacterium]
MTTTWRVLIDQRARKHLARLDPVIQRRIAKAIDALSTDPEPAGCKPLRSMTEVLRIRVGDYRIVYQLARADHVVQVLDIDHRKDIYR